ncbi:hypothetical protein ACWFNE_10515 [Cellulomonas sp. NPDC055163]
MPDESHESPQHRPAPAPGTPVDAAPTGAAPATTTGAASAARVDAATTTGAAPGLPSSAAPAEAAATTGAASGLPSSAAVDPVPTAPSPVPDEAELARVAEPATVRRAPKFGAFVTAGVLLGAVLGFVAALVTGSSVEGDGGTGFISFLDGQGSARLLVALAGATLGALVAGIAAVVADRRSLRGR